MSGPGFDAAAINGAAARTAERAEYMDVRLRMDDCDEASVARALYLIAELDGMSRVASKCGLSVSTMRRQLNGTRPLYFDTVLGVMRALGLRMRAEVA